MQIQDGKGRDREERNEWFRAPRRLASSDAKRVAQAHTLQASLDLQVTITDVTSRNRHVSARVLLQGGGSEGTVNRESVITNMEVSDVDVVKAANGAFFPGEEVLPNDDWTDLEPDRVQSGAGGSLVKTTNKKTLSKGFATPSLVDSTTAGHKGGEQCPWTRRWCARRRSEREHDHKQNKRCWLTSSTREETRVSEQRPRRRRLKDAGERGKARIRASSDHVKGAHDRSGRQYPSQESKSTRAVTHDLRTPSSVKSPTQGTCSPPTFAETISSVVLWT